MNSDTQLRLQALTLAVQNDQLHAIERAQRYYDFLTGKTTTE